uniref:Uncharacterized protein n=1 Tax=Candidatus Kentrum sp. TC TaxID=2126339 RepID=A0A450Z0G0_9GAMM|nr:MAG: hypothetical protein BECKTC1821E_GA0114239_10793 [Candidatus Kentron sp. TC]VFK51007.1 MAG: hypothetical protein BECKTC1821D_GA0114238_11283 [Candidatus Kentron sp. TC]VFK62558.1 MAG: hypothetical protein BECKTC1821F_GA0114240_10764 [Candidatus Kentron sp. TC]
MIKQTIGELLETKVVLDIEGIESDVSEPLPANASDWSWNCDPKKQRNGVYSSP